MKVSVHSLGLGIWVSSCSFQKRLASTASDRKGATIQLEFSYLCQKKIFQSFISAQIIKYKNLDAFEGLSDFPGLRNLYSLTDLSGLCNPLASNVSEILFFQKTILILMVWSSLVPKWPILEIFCKLYFQNPIFHQYMAPSQAEAVE